MRREIRLAASARAWGSPDFAATLCAEIAQLPPGSLPLQQALRVSSYALEDRIRVTLITAQAGAGQVEARVGVFFAGLIAGCNCADDPTPVEPLPEYCELLLHIELASGNTRVEPL
jgi:hypothetical protein